MTDLHFTKMHGAGNDFIIIDNREEKFTQQEIISLAPRLCNRHFGIGADGIMGLQLSADPAFDYTMFYRNADGSDAGMCGNGARCLALLAAKLGLGTQLAFNVHDTAYKAFVDLEQKYVTIFFPLQIRMQHIFSSGDQKMYQLYAGTEHLVLAVSDSAFKNDDKLRNRGKQLRFDTRFNPPGTNVNFICGQASNEIQIKTYERGVENLTLACGTGAIASAIAWHHIKKDNPQSCITVQTQGGTLKVRFNYHKEEDSYSDIELSGEACIVFEGNYNL